MITTSFFRKSWVAVLFLTAISALFAQSHQSGLRPGISADQVTIAIAKEMQKQGWVYIMPMPKSPQAAWGNSDGRTTWFVGYWKNHITNETSSDTPSLVNGKYKGDGEGARLWRRGGSPFAPTQLEWLLSKSGGIKPYQ